MSIDFKRYFHHGKYQVRSAVEAGDKAVAEEKLRVASRELDKAVSKGVFHRNTAANKKSGMANLFNKMEG